VNPLVRNLVVIASCGSDCSISRRAKSEAHQASKNMSFEMFLGRLLKRIDNETSEGERRIRVNSDKRDNVPGWRCTAECHGCLARKVASASSALLARVQLQEITGMLL
jgi:hypothetical protein